MGDGGPGTATGARGGHLSLAVDFDGSGAAAWDVLSGERTVRPWVVSRDSGGGAWPAPEPLAERGAWPMVSAGKEPLAVWQVNDPDGGGIWMRTRSNGRWDTPLHLGGDSTAVSPQVVGASQFGYAAWVSGSPPRAYATEIDPVAGPLPARVGEGRSQPFVRLAPGWVLIASELGLEWGVQRGYGRWEAREVLSPAYESGAYFDTSRGGRVSWALWDERGTLVASRGAPSGFGPLVPLFPVSPGFASAALASSPAGSIACLATVDARLQCSWSLGTTDFGPPDPLPLQATGATWIDVALDAQGGAAVAWASPAGLFAVRASGPGHWGQSQRIDRGEGGRPIEVRLRADSAARLFAVWTASADGRSTTIWASDFLP